MNEFSGRKVKKGWNEGRVKEGKKRVERR